MEEFMDDEVNLKKEWSTDGTWYRYADPRPLHVRNVSGSKTVGGRWFYGPNDDLEIRWEEAPERGWAIWFRGQRVGFSADIAPETVIGDSIRAAKRTAIELLSEANREGNHDPVR